MLTRRVDLRFPIELPGATIAHVTAHPIGAYDFQMMDTSDEARLTAFANCIRLPTNVAGEVDDFDLLRVVDAIADLSRLAVEQSRAESRPVLTLIQGQQA